MQYRSTPRFTFTVHVTPEDGARLDNTANDLGVSRHKLIRTAIELGLPLAAAQLRDDAARRLEGKE